MSVICYNCGSTEVFCKAYVNPNSNEVFDYEDEFFNLGWCHICDDEMYLFDTVKLLAKIDSSYNKYKTEFNKEPLFATCEVTFRQENGATECVLFKLNNKIEDNDDEIFFYCNGIDGLKSLVDFSSEEFMITDLQTIN